MTKKARTLFFVIGILVGLTLTACAGVAAGKIDLAGAEDTAFFFGPAVNVAPLPEIAINLNAAKPSLTADLVKDNWAFDHVKVNVVEVKEMEPLTVSPALQTEFQTQSQTQVQEQTQTGHFCNRP
jgi:hypothetical protein